MNNDEPAPQGPHHDSEPSHPDKVVDAEVIDRKKRGQPLPAWVVIVSIVALMVALPYLPVREEKPRTKAPASEFTQQVFGNYGKFIVAAADANPADSHEMYEAALAINSGPLDQRLWFVTVAADLAGPEKALDHLRDLKAYLKQSTVEHDADLLKAMSVLRRTYEDYADRKWNAPSLSAADRKLLKQQLGWFGRLALAPKTGDQPSAEREAVLQPARRVLAVFMALTLLLILLGLGGLCGFIAFIALSILGKLRSKVSTDSGNGGVYVETFAVWQVLFVGLSLAGVAVWRGNPLLQGGIALAVSGIVALAWPRWRGVAWPQTCNDIGLTRGKGLVEVGWGVVCYISSLPLLLIGFLIFIVLLRLATALSGAPQGDEFTNPTPSHPLPDWLTGAGAIVWLQAFVLACVVAPVVEEAMFRGVLYRHLREATAKWRIGFSVAASAIFNSLIFAAVHPQGWLAIPVLTALAVGFSLAREWRGSLIAPMTMHAVNNGLVLGMLMLASL